MGGPSGDSPSVNTAALDTATLDAWVDRELKGRLPSAVVALVDGNGLRWHRGVGARDARGGPPPDQTTVYRIGSITKVLTGIALLQLRDEGALTLDDPVAKWVPELASRMTAGGASVTLRHLVTHTSGISDIGLGNWASYWGTRAPSEAEMLRALDEPLEFAPPGTQSQYSNGGMAVAGLVVSRASRMTFRDAMQRRVLTPLGMKSAVWDRDRVPVDRLAIGVGPQQVIDPPHWQLGAFEPAGGLYASVEDMVGLARLALGSEPDVLRGTSLREALTDDPLPGPHGVAWIVVRVDGERVAAHSGSTHDYSATLWVVPDRGIAVIVLAASPLTSLALIECAATAIATSAIRGEAPPTCTTKPIEPGLRAAYDHALTQVRTILASPDPATIEAAFAPEFLAQVSLDTIVQMSQTVTSNVGRCDSHEITGPDLDHWVAATLHCEHGTVEVILHVQEAAPHRIDGLRFPEL